MSQRTDAVEVGVWAREFACGCREALADDECTSYADACSKHNDRVVVVGYLTREAVAADLYDAAKVALDYALDTDSHHPEDVVDALTKAVRQADATSTPRVAPTDSDTSPSIQGGGNG